MSEVPFVHPKNQQPLVQSGNHFADKDGNQFPFVNGVFRFVDSSGYSASFGYQWKKFKRTQLDKFSGQSISYDRFFSVTGWNKENLENKNILEVGCGAGRFTQIVLDYTKANLYCVDYSEAVESNFENNGQHQRLKIIQASIYEMPFAENSFDKIFYFGVLQHTPDINKSIECMVKVLNPGGELVVDFYPYNGFWTKINAKYLLRPFLVKMKHERLLQLIDAHIDWMIALSHFFNKIKIGFLLNRLIPVCDISSTLPENLPTAEKREWVKLDTFDMFSPKHDNPQRKNVIERYFKKCGMNSISCHTNVYMNNLKVTFCKATKRMT